MKRIEVHLPSKSPVGTRPGRAVRVAARIEATLRRFDALPPKGADRSLIGDLAVLEAQTLALHRAIRAFAATPGSAAGRRTFEDRLLDLFAHLDHVRGSVRDARGPLQRMVRRRCGYEGLATAVLRGTNDMLDAVSPAPRKSR